MPNYISLLPRRHITWVLATNGKQAFTYECDRVRKIIPLHGITRPDLYQEEYSWELTPLPQMLRAMRPASDQQLVMNGGAVEHAAVIGRRALKTHIGVHEALKRQLINNICIALDKAYELNQFQNLIIVAPSRTMQEIKSHLGPRFSRAITAELDRELIHYNVVEVAEYLKTSLPQMLG